MGGAQWCRRALAGPAADSNPHPAACGPPRCQVIFYGMGWILSVRMQRSYARMLGDEKMLKECNVSAGWESDSHPDSRSESEYL